MPNLVDQIITSVDSTSAAMVEKIYVALGLSLYPFIRTMLIISMVLFGLSMMAGWIDYPLRQFTKNIAKIVTVLTLAFEWPYFNAIIYEFFTESPDAIGAIAVNAISGGDLTSVSSQLGNLLHKGIVASGMAFSSSGIIMPYILGALIFIAVMAICGFSLALIVLSKVAMGVALALGPIFLLCILFENTRQMFSSWLQQIVNFALIGILTYIVMTFFVVLIEKTISKVTESPSLGDVVPICIIGMVGTFVLGQVMAIASGLAGGVQLHTMGAMSAIYRQIQRVNSGPAVRQANAWWDAGRKGLNDRFGGNNTVKRKL